MSRPHPNFFPNRIQTSFYGTLTKKKVTEDDDSLPKDIESQDETASTSTSGSTSTPTPSSTKPYRNSLMGLVQSRKPKNFI